MVCRSVWGYYRLQPRLGCRGCLRGGTRCLRHLWGSDAAGVSYFFRTVLHVFKNFAGGTSFSSTPISTQLVLPLLATFSRASGSPPHRWVQVGVSKGQSARHRRAPCMGVSDSLCGSTLTPWLGVVLIAPKELPTEIPQAYQSPGHQAAPPSSPLNPLHLFRD